MISSHPIRASTSRSWRAPSSLQRIDVPNAASPGRSLTKDPPSRVPVPVIVDRMGRPAAATSRVSAASSPRRARTAMRPMIAPPGTVTSGSRA
jgi:hypothetical protein